MCTDALIALRMSGKVGSYPVTNLILCSFYTFFLLVVLSTSLHLRLATLINLLYISSGLYPECISNRGKFLYCYRAVNEISSVQDSLCMTRSQKLKLRLALLTLSDSWYLTYHYRVAVARHRLSIAMKEVYIANNEHFFDRCQT